MLDTTKGANNTGPLLESERGFRLLVEGVIDYAIYMLDPGGTISNWNAGAERITGYKAEEAVGRHFSNLYTHEERDAGVPAKALETARQTGKFDTEGWLVRKDGTKFMASVVIDAIYQHGDLIGFAKITRDITQRNQAESALAESENQFRLLVGGVSDYALFMLNPEGIVTNWNIGGERIKGYRPDEIIGQHFSQFYTEPDRAAGRPARALRIASTTGHYDEEGWRVRKDGSFFWASVVIDAIRDDTGRLIGFAKITRDITERREAQQTLERVQRQLAESQKMDALGQLTGGIAHDFNNLLMIVSGNIQTLKSRVEGDPKAQRAVQAIETAMQRGAALTRQLLTFSRRQSLNPLPTDIPARIRSIADVLRSGLGGAIVLDIDMPGEVWPVTVDTTEFETALLNLVINARDAMAEGGRVTVSAQNVCDPETGHAVAISVEDTGQGIPNDILAKVFDPFFTTKPVGKGTGLGLSQVHGFAHQAGGRIDIESELGRGAVVTIYLPRARTLNVENRSQSRLDDASDTILLVEDNPDVATASAGLLEELGYRVRITSNAETALKEIESEGIDLVFSDIVMPGKMDGLGLAKALRARRPDLPILLTTGYSEALACGQNEFPILRKPYAIHELSQALAKLCQ
ncbi:PAS domain S-box protein [Nitrobacter sp.]|uniref:hybrid sensor histidine kinase/response regulator n=1 Tax=Nitrobacter sp. TaxID=29420 RepID=UPI003F64F03A